MTEALKAADAAAATVAVAPRVTLEALHARVAEKTFLRHGVLTICVLTMANGFMIVGHSAPASAANFDAALGERFAYEDAIRQAWGFEGYALRDRLQEVGDA